jgi:hypothetical protein
VPVVMGVTLGVPLGVIMPGRMAVRMIRLRQSRLPAS